MRPRKDERVGWGHVAAAAIGLLVTNLLLRLGLRRRVGPAPAAPVQWQRLAPTPEEADGARVIDHTPVEPDRRDMRLRPALIFVGGILAFMGFVTVLVTGLQWLQTGRLPSLQPPAGGVDDLPVATPPPEPRLGVPPQDTLAALRATEAAALDYGWVDEDAGITRLPVERAMELLAERGLPVAAGAEERHYQDAVPAWPLDSSSGREEERLWP